MTVFRRATLLTLALVVSAAPAGATWSVVAVNRDTGEVVIASATCVTGQALARMHPLGLRGVQAIVVPGKGGAVAQASVDTSWANQTFIHDELRKGTAPADIIKALQERDPRVASRQFGIVDVQGRTAGYSGAGNGAVSLDAQGQVAGTPIFFSIQGNILTNAEVVHEAVKAFRGGSAALTDRVMAAMEAADRNGGDNRCSCDRGPKIDAPCDAKTAHVAYILKAERTDKPGPSYNDGEYSLFIYVTEQDVRPTENANPVKTLRMRYDAWKKAPVRPAAQPPAPASVQRLHAAIERITRSINATWGIYVKSLETGEEIAIDADRQMETMSTIKIPLMVEVLEQVKARRFKLEDKYTLLKEDIQPGTGIMQRLDPGASLTVKDLVTLMIVVSDNTATEVLYRMVGGLDPVNRRMEGLGLKQTRAATLPAAWFAALRAAPSSEAFYKAGKVPFGLSTPREMGRLLELMERGTLVDKASSDLMLQIMRGQLYRTRIPRYLSGYRVPHKTGDFLPFAGIDVGVLEAQGRTIVLSVFTGNHFGSGETLENAIGVIAKEVADYFTYRQ